MRLEQRLETLGHALLRDRDERLHEALELVLGAVIGVQCDVDVVALGNRMRELSEGDCAGDHALDHLARGELRAAPGKLDDAIGLCLGETANGGDDGL